MISTEDLEIGSHIYLTATNEFVTVSEIISDEFIIVTNGRDDIHINSPEQFEFLEGIVLTARILSQNGFIRCADYVPAEEGVWIKFRTDSEDIYLEEENGAFSMTQHPEERGSISLPFVHIAQRYFSIGFMTLR